MNKLEITHFSTEPIRYEAGRDAFYNRVIIPVDLSSSSNLDFTPVINEADRSIAQNKRIVWDFHFDLDCAKLNSQAYFSSLHYGLETFINQVLLEKEEFTDAVIALKAQSDIFSQSELKGIEYHEMKEWVELQSQQNFDPEKHRSLVKAFQISYISDVLHRLCSILPDEIPSLVVFDRQCFENTIEMAALLSKRTFPYIIPCSTTDEIDFPLVFNSQEQKVFAPEKPDKVVGFSLPEWDHFSSETIALLQDLYEQFQKETKAYIRMVPEELFMEEWEDLSSIIVCNQTLGERGRRMLKGFIATDGEVLTEESLTLA